MIHDRIALDWLADHEKHWCLKRPIDRPAFLAELRKGVAMSNKVYGDQETKHVHSDKRGDQCREGEIKDSNLVHFKDLEDATSEGYVPCNSCYPPDES